MNRGRDQFAGGYLAHCPVRPRLLEVGSRPKERANARIPAILVVPAPQVMRVSH